ncbi:unnamed protein product [Auanema sp. JU1783]|nr:unnamed protein product [Auanema sp. JU1783]
MAFYEKGEHYVQEKRYRNGFTKEVLDEEQWQRSSPGFPKSDRLSLEKYRDDYHTNHNNHIRYVKIPAERVVDDYRRVDYTNEDDDNGFYIRRPASNRSSQNRPPSDELIYNIQHPRSELGSPGNQTNYKTSTRPGSPGPVAGVGDITNTEHGFTIELDVKLFRPEEIKVVLNDNHLSITGERIEQCGDGQTLRRSFTRKYSIPTDVHLDSIRSHLADNGVLYINGSRRGWKETNLIYHGANNSMYGRSGSVISTV